MQRLPKRNLPLRIKTKNEFDASQSNSVFEYSVEQLIGIHGREIVSVDSQTFFPCEVVKYLLDAGLLEAVLSNHEFGLRLFEHFKYGVHWNGWWQSIALEVLEMLQQFARLSAKLSQLLKSAIKQDPPLLEDGALKDCLC